MFSRKAKAPVSTVSIENEWPFEAESGFVVFDIETTGLSPKSDRMIEIALIRTDRLGKPLAYWSTLVNPRQPVRATEIHGIHDADVAGAPVFDDIYDELARRIRGQALSAHNAKFDVSFLQAEFARTGWELPEIPVMCTMQESRNFIHGLAKRRLQDCVAAIGVQQDVEHRALGDATLTTTLVNFYLNSPTNTKRSGQLRQLPDVATNSKWPSARTVPQVPVAKSTQKYWRAAAPKNSALGVTISSIMPEDLLGDDTPVSELTYAQVLLEAMEDGVVTKEEHAALIDLANALDVSSNNQTSIHEKLMKTLAQEAWKDGVVNKAERTEIIAIGESIGFSESDAKDFIKEIEELRADRLGARAKNLPEDWDLGEPLRVGDRIVITGCYESGREDLETRSKKMGLQIRGAVSGKTTLLVSDGTVNGNKDSDAARLGIRSVSPEIFSKLLDYIQPARTDDGPTSSDSPPMPEESLVCIKCGEIFKRTVSKGRKPHSCPECR